MAGRKCTRSTLSVAIGASACRFMAFDRHMNLVLGDSEEFRKLPPKKGQEEVRCCGCQLCLRVPRPARACH